MFRELCAVFHGKAMQDRCDLCARGYEVDDLGMTDENHPLSYHTAGYRVGRAIQDGLYPRAILVCGTGIGMSIAANKIHGIRAACCSDTFSARFTRMHNDANALCLGERVCGAGLALDIVELFLTTEFESGGRHSARLAKINNIENK